MRVPDGWHGLTHVKNETLGAKTVKCLVKEESCLWGLPFLLYVKSFAQDSEQTHRIHECVGWFSFGVGRPRLILFKCRRASRTICTELCRVNSAKGMKNFRSWNCQDFECRATTDALPGIGGGFVNASVEKGLPWQLRHSRLGLFGTIYALTTKAEHGNQKLRQSKEGRRKRNDNWIARNW